MKIYIYYLVFVATLLASCNSKVNTNQGQVIEDDRGATDFVFGSNELTDNIVAKRIENLSGILHNHRIEPRDPNLGEDVNITVTVGDKVDAVDAWCYYTVDGTNPDGSNGVAKNGVVIPLKQTDVVWEDLIWGYLTEFKGTIPGLPKGGIVRYIIEVGGQYAKGTEGTEGSSKSHPYFAYAVDDWTIPDWVHDAVMYYVMPDRFNPGKDKSWIQTDNLEKSMGGTLKGIQEKLDHLESLGVNVLWLMPFMHGPEYHKYGTVDFYAVDPGFGTEEDLRNLIDDAHSRGMKVIVDFVANHCSDQHKYFQEALNNPDSKYRDWFEFHDDGGYESFFGGGDLPHLVNENPEVREYIIELGKHWLTDLGLDGFDLDYAIGPSHEFWATFGYEMRQLDKEVVIFTEGVTTPESLLSYVGRVAGCQDFGYCQASRKTFAYDKMNVEEFERYLKGSEVYFPDGFIAPVMIDNQNMDRFLFVANDEEDRLKAASAVLYSMSRPISIWAGTELGMSQAASSVKSTLSASRHATDWENINEDVLKYFQKLGNLRHKYKAMDRGDRTPLIADSETGILVYKKSLQNEPEIFVVVNTSKESQVVELPISSNMKDVLNGISVNTDNGKLSITVPKHTAAYLVAE